MRGVRLLALLLGLAAAPALAKTPPCEGRFLVDDATAPIISGDQTPPLHAVVLAERKVEIESGARCTFTKASRKRTRHGWKLSAGWNRCGSFRHVRLRANV